MDRESLFLAAMSCAGGGEFTPVQIQKYFFIIERELKSWGISLCFDFVAYDYGPFDSGVYRFIEGLAEKNFAQIIITPGIRYYKLTPEGQMNGERAFKELDPNVQEYLQKLVTFVRSVSFNTLVSAVYKAYPDMKVNSVFNKTPNKP